MAAETGHLRIGELSRRSGVSNQLLRAWERRYGLLEPMRTEGGYRLYSDQDERRVVAEAPLHSELHVGTVRGFEVEVETRQTIGPVGEL